MASILAAQRDDIVNLRTIAGNLDNDALVRVHNVTPMPYSLNAADYASHLQSVPQIHFIGSKDKVVTKAVTQSYLSKLGSMRCVQVKEVAASHTKGWQQSWGINIQQEPTCR